MGKAKKFFRYVSRIAVVTAISANLAYQGANAQFAGVHTDASAKVMHAATVASITSAIAAMETALAASIVAFQAGMTVLITEQTRVIDGGNEKLGKIMESLANGQLRARNESENIAMIRDVTAKHQAPLSACIVTTAAYRDEVLSVASAATQQANVQELDDQENGRKFEDMAPEEVATTFQSVILSNRTGQDGTPIDSAVKAGTIFGTNTDLSNSDPAVERKARNNAMSIFAGRPAPQAQNPTSTLSAQAVADRATASIRRSTSTEALAYIDSIMATPAAGADGTKWPSRFKGLTVAVDADFAPEAQAAFERMSEKEALESLNRKMALSNKLKVIELEFAARQLALLSSLNLEAVSSRESAEGVTE